MLPSAADVSPERNVPTHPLLERQESTLRLALLCLMLIRLTFK